jgi:hypothetical protein
LCSTISGIHIIAQSNRTLMKRKPHDITSVNLDKTILLQYHYFYIYIYRFQNVFLRCLTPRLHCFLSSRWPSFRFVLFMTFLITFIQFFFCLLHALFCFGIHFNIISVSLLTVLKTLLYYSPYIFNFKFYYS